MRRQLSYLHRNLEPIDVLIAAGASHSALKLHLWQKLLACSETFGETNQTDSYLVNLSDFVLSSNDGDSSSVLSLLLASGASFGFRVISSDNVGNSDILSITNFSATPVTTPASVPGPLPLAGGLAAFAWSRRLRSRVREHLS